MISEDCVIRPHRPDGAPDILDSEFGLALPIINPAQTVQEKAFLESPQSASAPDVAKPIEAIQETLQLEAESPSVGGLLEPSGLQVELKGVMTGPDGQMRFSFVIIMPNGVEDPMMLSLGTNLWGDWDVSEYNPAFGTVTLQRGEKLLILRRGERIDLPI